MKTLRTLFDPITGKSYRINLTTGVVCGTDGEYPSKEDEARILKAMKRRIRNQHDRAERDQAMRDLGLVKVRGAVSGKVYWE